MTTPSKPPAPKTKVITFHVYRVSTRLSTASQVNALAKTMVGGRYVYRADVVWNSKTGRVLSAPLWAKGVSTWQYETQSVTVPVNATPQQILAAEQKRAAAHDGVDAGASVKGKTGHRVVTSWLVPDGAWSSSTTWKQGPSTKPQVLLGSKLF